MNKKVLSTQAEIKNLYGLMPDFKMPVYDLPIGEKFKAEFTIPDKYKALGDLKSENVGEVSVTLRGDTLNTKLSLFKFSYLMINTGAVKIGTDGKVFDKKTGKVEITSSLMFKGIGLTNITSHVKLSSSNHLISKKLMVIAQVKVMNKFKPDEVKLRTNCYTGAPKFNAVMTGLSGDFNDPDVRTAYNNAIVELYQSEVVDEAMLEDPLQWATIPIVEFV